MAAKQRLKTGWSTLSNGGARKTPAASVGSGAHTRLAAWGVWPGRGTVRRVVRPATSSADASASARKWENNRKGGWLGSSVGAGNRMTPLSVE